MLVRSDIKDMGNVLFDDFLDNTKDAAQGRVLAYVIGDTCVDNRMSSAEQWRLISKALRVHGLKIVKE